MTAPNMEASAIRLNDATSFDDDELIFGFIGRSNGRTFFQRITSFRPTPDITGFPAGSIDVAAPEIGAARIMKVILKGDVDGVVPTTLAIGTVNVVVDGPVMTAAGPGAGTAGTSSPLLRTPFTQSSAELRS